MERKTVITLVICSLIFLINGVLFLSGNYSSFSFTAKVPATGSITIEILEPLVIEITSPENITYNFTYSERMTSGAPDVDHIYFQILLNATSNREIDSWNYKVIDDEDIAYFEDEPIFNLGTVYPWRQYGNNLTVFAQPISGSGGTDNALFYINLTSAAPEFTSTETNFWVCEGNKLTNATLEVRDVNGDLDTVYVNPNYNLFGQPAITAKANNYYDVKLKSFYTLDSNETGIYSTNATAKDLDGQFSPNYPLNITVIELNDNPEVTFPPSLPDNESDYNVYVKLYLEGEHTTYNATWTITDEEDINLSYGGLKLNLTFANGSAFDLFTINNETGLMYYKATDQSPIGNYSLILHITDSPLDNPSDKISYCANSHNGSSNTLPYSIYFVISDTNRQPYFTDYSPENETLYTTGADTLQFNVSFFDSDYDVLYTDWFVGGRWLSRHGSFNYSDTDEYDYSFGCGIGGWYNITVSLNDGVQGGEVNHTWQTYVSETACPSIPQGGGGGGGGGGSTNMCYEDWVCNDWATCQELTGSTKSGLIDTGDYQTFIEQCKQLGYEKENWGFQLRECYDSNECNNFEYRIDPPEQSQVCFYTENPNCDDNIKNCHDGSCEIAVDCGGPCSACPNCNDGIKNQNEEGIDCGGPCPDACKRSSADVRPDILLILTIFFILILLFVVYRVIVIVRRKKEKKEASRQEKIHELFNQ